MIKKLGLVLECEAGGPDELVFKCLVRRLSPGTEVICAARGGKPRVFEGGVAVAAALIELSECDLVLIVWDLKPLLEKIKAKSCVDETAELRRQLDTVEAKVRAKIQLLCLTYELETWMLAEENAIRAYLSTPAHQSKFKVPGKAISKTDPKAIMKPAFESAKGFKYQDFTDAIQIVRLWTDTRRLRGVQSFQRFCMLLTGDANADFKKDASVCADLGFQARMMGKR